MSVFYETYGASKNYTTPRLTKKHIRKFDSEVWQPSGLTTGMRCLEIGCGTGHFLNYLHTKGVTDLKAIDHDGRGWLIIDDLVDTGRTAEVVRKMLPQAHFATIYAKPAGRPLVDTFVTEVSQDTWILFPWDSDIRFVKPIAGP